MTATPDPVYVLHVDDEPDFAAMAAQFITRESNHIEVDAVTSADEALERLEADHIDCVVSDYDMPGRNGIELLEAVRDRKPDLPFILFTGKGSEEIASDAISAGVTDYLQKRVGTDQYQLLVNRIENAIGKRRAEMAVETTRQRFQRLIQESSDVIAVVDPSGRFGYVSPSADRVLGYRPDELLGDIGFDYIHPDDREAAMTAFESMVVDPGHRPSIEFRFDHGQSGWTWLEARGRNLLEDPVIEGIVVYVRDVTNQREQSAQFEALIERSSDIITVLDADGTITYESPSIERLLGYAPDELVGEHAFDYVHPEDRQSALETFASVLAADGPDIGRERYRFRHADGSWVWLETVGSNRSSGVLDGIVLNTRDITEQKRREQALERYETMVNQSGDLIYAADPEGVLTAVNDAAARFVGYSREELVGAHVSKVLTEASLADGRAVIRELLAAERDGTTYEMDLLTADDQTVHCENHVTLLTGDEGVFRGSVGVVRDISSR